MSAVRIPLPRALLAVAALAAAAGCGSDGACPARPTIAVLGAMPSELAPLLERASVDESRTIAGRVFHRGTLGSLPVVLAMTGIGMVNAAETTRLVLDEFAVQGVVFSGVGGSPHRIGDVTVPESWSEPGGPSYPVDPEWLELARAVAAAGFAELERCTPHPLDHPAAEPVCLPFAPAIVVGGRGESSDPFGGAPLVCQPGGDDVFGCDPTIVPTGAADVAAARRPAVHVASVAPADEPTVDMETAAAAREAAARGRAFLAFRAVSDGAEDPLGLPGFPAQFFAYYRLAAENAAAATARFLTRLSAAEQEAAPFCR